MTYPVFTNGQVLPASDLNAIGLWLVKSQTIGSGVSSVNVTSCFSSTYDNYVIEISGVSCSVANSVLTFKLLSGTTPTTSGFYGNVFYVVSGSASGLANAPLSNTANGECMSVGTASTNSGEFYVQGPYLAAYTRANFTSADQVYLRYGAFCHASATSYDGIQINPFSGTMTGGTISVYGYRKA